jgi:hypothetical protein
MIRALLTSTAIAAAVAAGIFARVNGESATHAPAHVSLSAASSAAAAKTCAPGGTITLGEYYLFDNEWGASSGSGSTCVSGRRSGTTLIWTTNWSWTGSQYSVKAYPSAVLGWHWGWKTTGTGLPVRLSTNKRVSSTWKFKVSGRNTLDVSYDMWLHTISSPTWANQPADEVMVWLYRSGGANPLGTLQRVVTIGGATWDLYSGTNSWHVYSFVRVSESASTSSVLNLQDFLNGYLVKHGYLSKSLYLTSVESGTEVFTGKGSLTTTAYTTTTG